MIKSMHGRIVITETMTFKKNTHIKKRKGKQKVMTRIVMISLKIVESIKQRRKTYTGRTL